MFLKFYLVSYNLMHIISLCSYIKINSLHQTIRVGIPDGISYANMVLLNAQATCIKPAF